MIQDLHPDAAKEFEETLRFKKKLVACELRVKLLRNLQEDRIGTPEVEESLRKIFSKKNQDWTKELRSWRGTKTKVVGLILKGKIRDSEQCLRVMKRKYLKSKQRLMNAVKSKHEARKSIVRIEEEGRKLREEVRMKHDKKRKHLRMN